MRVGLEEVDDGIWSLYFCNVLLGRIDERKALIKGQLGVTHVPGSPGDRSCWSLTPGDSTGQGGCRSSFLEPPARSLRCACAPQFGKPAVEAAGAADAEHASTAPWKTAKHAVSHSYHRPSFFVR